MERIDRIFLPSSVETILCSRHAIILLLDQIFALILMSRILLLLFHRSIISRCLYCVRMLECDAMVQISSLLCIRAELRENLSRIREIERNWKWRLFGIGRTVECFCQTNEEIRKF